MKRLKPGRTVAAATVSYVDPFESPIVYGADRFGPGMSDGAVMPDLVERRLNDLWDAGRKGDESRARSVAWDLRDWWTKHATYEVLDSGEGHVDVPALVTSAPDVPNASVEAAWSSSDAHGGGLELKVAGNGLSADAKVTITDTFTIAAGPGEVSVLHVALPVAWEARLVRLDGQYEPVRELVVSPRKVTGPLDISVQVVAKAPVLLTQKSQVVDLRQGGTKPTKLAHTVSLEASGGFSVGFKALGMDATVTVTRERSLGVELTAELPSGHEYDLDWLAAPPGARVTMHDA